MCMRRPRRWAPFQTAQHDDRKLVEILFACRATVHAGVGQHVGTSLPEPAHARAFWPAASTHERVADYAGTAGLLIARGATVSAIEALEHPRLHGAASSCNREVGEILVASGSDLSQ